MYFSNGTALKSNKFYFNPSQKLVRKPIDKKKIFEELKTKKSNNS